MANYNISDGTILVTAPDDMDSVYVCYRVFPYDFHKEIRDKSIQLYDSNAFFPVSSYGNKNRIQDTREELFTTENLYKSGMISRGVSFGNRQDIFVNSVLNLQLEGKLSGDLNIKAAVTDQNIPYQPEGNTKLVQDFDNVYFELYNDHFSVAGGDLVLQNQTSDFLRFNRNVQGAMIRSEYHFSDGIDGESQIAVSVSKGKFYSERLEMIDGVMGPYKIYGPEQGSFIIIVAGSEKVYLDSKILERGFNNDYVIDYNTAQITFTSRVLITKFSRVNIDFEYTNQAYSRTILNVSQKQKIRNAEISVQYYQEKDNRRRPLSFTLDNSEEDYLSNIYGNDGTAMLPGWDSVAYNENRVLYKKTDTLDIDGNRISIFQYSRDQDSAVYQVVFSEVGSKKGSYSKKDILVNGKVFEWVGKSHGNYIPVKVIPLPDIRQMLSVRTSVRIGEMGSVYSEVAFSKQDQNLFNENEQSENGFALKTGILSGDMPLGKFPGYTANSGVSFEYDNKGFRQIDRFRPVEFDRDWNYYPDQDSLPGTDRIINLFGSIKKDIRHYLKAGITQRQRPGMINGWQGNLESKFDFSFLNLSGDLFLMKNENTKITSDWIRYHADGYIKSRIIYPGYRYTVDHNTMSPALTDSITSTEMNYQEHMFYIRNSDSLQTDFNINYRIRTDRIPVFGEMRDQDISKTANATISTKPGKTGKFDFTMTYRELAYMADSLNEVEKSMLGRLDWSVNLFKNHIRSDISYATGNGRELKREFVFIEVPVGQGTHTWRDDNMDGKQELNEFYLAMNPDEKNFIKLFTPTDEYVLAYNNILNYRLSASMPRQWKHATGIKKLLGNFSNSFSIDLNQKISNADFWKNIFFRGNSDNFENLISYNENLRNNFYFNRADPRYGFEMILNRLNYKQLLSGGYESRDKMLLKIQSRINVMKQYNIIFGVGKSDLNCGSDYLPGRNFDITGKKMDGTVEWQPSNFLRIGTDYSYDDNRGIQETENNKAHSLINELSLNLKWSRASDKNVDLSFHYINIDFEGDKNTPIGYELLKGLQPGNNLTWSLSWQQKLFSGMQMNISYEGRKSGSLDVIHIGRMQVTALF